MGQFLRKLDVKLKQKDKEMINALTSFIKYSVKYREEQPLYKDETQQIFANFSQFHFCKLLLW